MADTTTSTAAMLALEQRIRAANQLAMDQLATDLNAALAPAVQRAPSNSTGTDVLSDPKTHATVAQAVDDAQQQVDTNTRAGYAAAALIALAAFAALHGDAPDSPPDPGTGTLAAIIAGIAAAFAAFLPSWQSTVTAAYNGVQPAGGPGSSATTARIVATNQATLRLLPGLTQRTSAAAVFATYAGNAETDIALWQDRLADESNDDTSARKRWVVQSPTPCPSCAALDGVEVGLNEQFPYGDDLPVYNDLFRPPRHPNCRCRIQITA